MTLITCPALLSTNLPIFSFEIGHRGGAEGAEKREYEHKELERTLCVLYRLCGEKGLAGYGILGQSHDAKERNSGMTVVQSGRICDCTGTGRLPQTRRKTIGTQVFLTYVLYEGV